MRKDFCFTTNSYQVWKNLWKIKCHPIHCGRDSCWQSQKVNSPKQPKAGRYPHVCIFFLDLCIYEYYSYTHLSRHVLAYKYLQVPASKRQNKNDPKSPVAHQKENFRATTKMQAPFPTKVSFPARASDIKTKTAKRDRIATPDVQTIPSQPKRKQTLEAEGTIKRCKTAPTVIHYHIQNIQHVEHITYMVTPTQTHQTKD